MAFATDPEALPAPDPPGFVVYCDVTVDDEQAARIVRLIEQARPVGVGYRLRVRRAASKDKGGGE